MEDKNKNLKKINKDEPNPNQNNLWNEILREALTKKDLEQSHLFVFGDKNTGKKNIIKNINKDLLNKTDPEDSFKRPLNPEDKDSSKYALVDYTYVNIKKLNESDSDVIGKVNVWIMNDFLDKEMFETIFKPEYILKSVCMVVVDLSRPWEIIESLRKWCNYIYDSFGSLMMKFPLEKQEELRTKITEYVKLFEEVQVDEEGNIKRDKLPEETIRLKKSLELKEGLLKTNLGIPIIFVINKSDIVNASGEKKRFEEDSEFILKHIRNLALGYAATTIYTSTKCNYNLNVLYDYFLHRVYNFDLTHRTNVTDKDYYFIPCGYDSATVLKGYDLCDDLSKLYSDRIPPIKPKGSANKEVEIFCEDLQVFLNKYRAGKKIPGSSNYSTNNPYPNENNIAPSLADSTNQESKMSSSGLKLMKEDMSNGNSLHRKSNTNSTTDFSKFLKNNNSLSTLNSGTSFHNTNNDLNSNDKKINSVLESVKKNEASKLIKDEKQGDKSKDLMKKIAALRNKKTQNENKRRNIFHKS